VEAGPKLYGPPAILGSRKVKPAVELIYKVCQNQLFEASVTAGRFLGAPIDTSDGYIHFSTAEQLRETLRLYFAGQTNLTLFSVPCSTLGDRLVWEPSRGGALFPHVYGDLAMDEIVDSAVIAVADDGRVDLPEWVQ
jgi:uncharacterized protein (DUF952 family)